MSTTCLACGETELRQARRYRTHSRAGRAIFGQTWLCVCSQCELVQVAPFPDPQALAEYYSSDYRNVCWAGSDVASVSQFPMDNLFYYNRGQSIAELLAQYIETENPEILDIGAGWGHVLYALGQRYPGSARLAIEFSEVCVEHLKSLGVLVFTQPAEDILPQTERRFDVIILSHVLEHLLDPSAVLQLIYDKLKPGGVLYVEVPNIPAESLALYPDNVWAPRFDEPHITFFSQSTVQNLLGAAGLKTQFCDTAGPLYKNISPLRFHLPHGRWLLQSLIPPSLFLLLRQQRLTKPLRVQQREESFYEYGGVRIWIRSVSRKRESQIVDDSRSDIR